MDKPKAIVLGVALAAAIGIGTCIPEVSESVYEIGVEISKAIEETADAINKLLTK